MSQNFNNLVSGVTTFANLYAIINNNFAAVITQFSGTSFPSNPSAYQICVRTDLTRMYYYTGTTWADITDLFPAFQTLLAEVVAARGSAASVNARLSVAMNDDGTLKGGAPAGSWWSTEADAVARVSGTQFTVTGDKTAIYKANRALYVTQTSSAYGFVSVDSTYSGGTGLTTVTVTGVTIDTGITSVQYGQPVTNAPKLPVATAAQELTGASAVLASSPSVSREYIINLKPVVNASVNKLDILTKSTSAVPDASNPIKVMIPDGAGNTQRTRTANAIQFTLNDATGYWGIVSSATDKLKLHPYAIWDSTNSRLIFALSRFSGFNQVPTTTTNTDDDYFLFENSLSPAYTPSATDHCVCIGDQWATYNTANTPDWTFLDATTAVEFSPQVIWNPKSDYARTLSLATSISSGGNISDNTVVNTVVKQSGKYLITGQLSVNSSGTFAYGMARIKTGSSTYGSAVQKAAAQAISDNTSDPGTGSPSTTVYLNAGDTIHLGGSAFAASGTRYIYGDNTEVGATQLSFTRTD
jgi:hypothetical protein